MITWTIFLLLAINAVLYWRQNHHLVAAVMGMSILIMTIHHYRRCYYCGSWNANDKREDPNGGHHRLCWVCLKKARNGKQ